MLTFSARNFRCFEDLSVTNLSRINLVTGKNSARKTSLLEAIFLLVGGGNLTLVKIISDLRGIVAVRGNRDAWREISWPPLFGLSHAGLTPPPRPGQMVPDGQGRRTGFRHSLRPGIVPV